MEQKHVRSVWRSVIDENRGVWKLQTTRKGMTPLLMLNCDLFCRQVCWSSFPNLTCTPWWSATPTTPRARRWPTAECSTICSRRFTVEHRRYMGWGRQGGGWGRQGRNQIFISGGVGGEFLWNFIRRRHRAYSTVVQLFRKRSQIKFFSQHFRKWELFSFNLDADRTIRTE